jgi:putative addiction module component (TIGR02574 family)
MERMKNLSPSEILQLSISERIQLVEDIWDSIAAVPEAVPLTDAQREELDRRLAAYHKNPQSGTLWDEVKKRLSDLT